jgi:hypothetical protein
MDSTSHGDGAAGDDEMAGVAANPSLPAEGEERGPITRVMADGNAAHSHSAAMEGAAQHRQSSDILFIFFFSFRFETPVE